VHHVIVATRESSVRCDMAYLAYYNEITILGYPSALSETPFPGHEFIFILLSQFLLWSHGNICKI
jgi:hypothetical protein